MPAARRDHRAPGRPPQDMACCGGGAVMGAVTKAAWAGLAPYFCGRQSRAEAGGAMSALHFQRRIAIGRVDSKQPACRLPARRLAVGPGRLGQHMGETKKCILLSVRSAAADLDDAGLLGHGAGAAAGVHAAVAWHRGGTGCQASGGQCSTPLEETSVLCKEGGWQCSTQGQQPPPGAVAAPMHAPHGSGGRLWAARSCSRLGPAIRPCRQQ